jgi:serine-type D-Ala-D-Ala carboxypeptidase (penicillin-binding protein 5/6)
MFRVPMNPRNLLQLLAIVPAMFAATHGRLSAQGDESVMVMEAHSGKILFALNSNQRRPVASLAKMATAAVAIDWATATGNDIGKTTMVVPQTITLVGGPNPMNLQPGERLTLRDALFSAMLGSDNLAALTIADHVGREILRARGRQGEPVVTFVAEMNRLAKALGMTQTRFNNPHGLDRPRNPGALSTAADMARLSVYVMRKPPLTFITRQTERRVHVTGVQGRRSFLVRNTNELAGGDGVLGIKTGTTAAAGPCLATCVERDPVIRTMPDGSKGVTPRRLVIVVLNNPDRFNRTRGLIHQGWGSYDRWLAAGAPMENPRREKILVPDLE